MIKKTIYNLISHSFFQLKRQNIQKLHKNILRFSIQRLLISSTGLFICFWLIKENQVHMIEDESLRKIKIHMSNEVNKLKSQFGQMTVYPDIKFDMRAHTYTVTFQIDQRKCDIFSLLTNFFAVYNSEKGFKVVDYKAFTSKDGIITSYIDFQENDPQFRSIIIVNKAPQKGRITITGIKTSERPNFRMIFEKNDTLTPKNMQALAVCYREAVRPKQSAQTNNYTSTKSSKNRETSNFSNSKKQPQNKLYKKLEQYGVTIFDPNNKEVNLDWDYLAGYENQKRSIQDTVLLALNYPQIYDEITEATRMKYEPNRPKAVLFQGPPGTGKTTSAKIISQQVNIPLIYMPIEAIMSKFYGESEQKLSEMWEICKSIGKVIIFIDQIDALAGSRNTDMHQASRRVLSTLLRKIDSFQSTTDVLLVCATNRKQDLDPAMLSRIDLCIKFSLPDRQSRAAIFKRYAKHLQDQDLENLATETEGFSGRNISDVCKHAERKWASKLIRKQVDEKLPDMRQYLLSLKERKIHELS